MIPETTSARDSKQFKALRIKIHLGFYHFLLTALRYRKSLFLFKLNDRGKSFSFVFFNSMEVFLVQ